MNDEVNIVNSEILLRERGIKLSEESHSEKGPFSSSLRVKMEAGGRTYTAAGTLFGSDMPRLIRLDAFRLEAYLDGVLLFFTHHDVPGIIGSVGTTFGNHNVNIAQMAVGRSDPDGEAVGVLNLDGRPPQAAMDEILRHPDIIGATVIELPAADALPVWLQI